MPCGAVEGECRAQFGLGYVCGDNGFCSAQPRSELCTETYPDDLFEPTPENSRTVVLGSLFNLETQRVRNDAVELALEGINLQGGLEHVDPVTREVTRRPFGLVSCDLSGDSSTTTAEVAVNAANYLTEALGVPALIGPSGSADVDAVYKNLKRRDVFIGSPSATSDSLFEIDQRNPTDAEPGLLWRNAPSDSEQIAKIVDDMVARGSPRVAVIAQTGGYGEGLSAGFYRSYARNDVPLSKFGDGTELESAIANVGKMAVEEVLFIASSLEQVVTFLDGAAKDPGFAEKRFFLTDSAATQGMIALSPATLFGRIRGTRPLIDVGDSVYNQFDADYNRKHGVHPIAFNYTAHAHDMAWIVALGAAWALFLDPVEPLTGLRIAQGARRLSSGEELELMPTSWGSVPGLFRDGESIDIRGASGPLDYDPATEETTGAIEVWTIDTSKNPPEIVAAPPLRPPTVEQLLATPAERSP